MKVLEPAGEPGVQVRRRLVADRRPVDVARDHFECRVEAQLGEQVVVVLADPLAVGLVIGPDGDVAVRRICLGDELFRPVQVGTGYSLYSW